MIRFAALLLIAAAASPASAQIVRAERQGERGITYIVQEEGEAPIRQSFRMAPGLRGLRLPPARDVAAAMLGPGTEGR